ncbi:MAG: GNAT family N-acetyltransferase [Elusimicrobiota bacterium]
MQQTLESQAATKLDQEELLFLWDEYILRNRFGKNWQEIGSHIFAVDGFDPYEHCIVSRESGKIISAVAIMPMSLKISGLWVDTGLITGVVTRPEARGRGLMSLLMRESETFMARKKQPLAILWGYRDRYGRFGYESCGSRNKFFVPKRKFQPIGEEERSRLRKLDGSRDKQLLSTIIGEGNLTLKNVPHHAARVFGKALQTTYVFDDPSRPALVSFSNSQDPAKRTLEVLHAGGDFNGVKALLDWKMAQSEYGDCSIYADPSLARDPIFFRFYEWAHREYAAHIRINDFDALMAKLAPSIVPHLDSLGRSVRLTMKRGDSEYPWSSCPNDSHPTIGVTLSDTQMVRLLLGPEKPSELPFIPENGRILDAVFPLPFHIIPIEGA